MKLRRIVTSALPSIIAVWVLVELLSLRLGWLNRFFYGASLANVQVSVRCQTFWMLYVGNESLRTATLSAVTCATA